MAERVPHSNQEQAERQLQLRILGPALCVRGVSRISLPHKVLALLAYLSESPGRTAEANAVASLLWGKDTRHTRHSLNQALYTAKRLLGGDVIHRAEHRITLSQRLYTDAQIASRSLHEGDVTNAIHAWRGTFLESIGDFGSDDFDEWCSERRAYYHNTFRKATLTKISRLQASNDFLGLQELMDAITDRPSFPEIPITLPTSLHGDQSHNAHLLSTWTFVGRHSELERLQQAVETMLRGTSTTVIVAGSAGIGKTSLLNHFLDGAAKSGVTVLSVQAFRAEEHTAFNILAQIAGWALKLVDPGHLPETFRSPLSLLCPEAVEANHQMPLLSGPATRRLLFESVTTVLRELSARKPLCIAVDDLHCVDEASLAGIFYMCRSLANSRVVFVGTVRTGSHRPIVSAFCDVERPHCERLELTEFSHREVAELVRRTRPDWESNPHLATRAFAATLGHPMLVTEALRATPEPVMAGPSIQAQYFLQEFSQLKELDRRFLEALAVAGGPEDLDILADVTAESALTLASSAARLSFYISNHAGGRIAFRHELLSDVVRDNIQAIRKQILHKAFAEALIRRQVGGSRIVRHLAESNDDVRTVTYALIAAREAREVHAPDESDFFFNLAVSRCRDELSRLKILREQANMLHVYGNYQRTGHAAKTILQSPLLAPDERLKWQARVLESSVLSDSNEIEFSSSELRSIRAQAQSQRDWPRLLEALQIQTRAEHIGLFEQSDDDLVELQRSLGLISLHADFDTKIESQLLLAVSMATTGSAMQALHEMNDLALDRDGVSLERRISIGIVSSLIHYYNGILHSAIDDAERVADIIDRTGAIYYKPQCLNLLGSYLLEAGDFDRAQQVLSAGIAASHDARSLRHAFLLHNAAWVAYINHDFDQCVDLLELIHAPQRTWIAQARDGLLGLCYLEQGHHQAAHGLADEVHRSLESTNRLKGDISTALTLISRSSVTRRREASVRPLIARAVTEYSDRDVLCCLRAKLAYAETIARSDGLSSMAMCNAVAAKAEAEGYVSVGKLAARTVRSIRRVNPLLTGRGHA